MRNRIKVSILLSLSLVGSTVIAKEYHGDDTGSNTGMGNQVIHTGGVTNQQDAGPREAPEEVAAVCSPAGVETNETCSETENKFSDCLKTAATTKAMAMAAQQGSGSADIYQTLVSTSQTMAVCSQNISAFIRSCKKSAGNCNAVCTQENEFLTLDLTGASQPKIQLNNTTIARCQSVSSSAIAKAEKNLAQINNVTSVLAVALPMLKGMFADKKMNGTDTTKSSVDPRNFNSGSAGGGNKTIGSTNPKGLGDTNIGLDSSNAEEKPEGGKNPQQLGQFGQGGGSTGSGGGTSSGGGQGLADSYKFENQSSGTPTNVFSDSFSSSGGGGRKMQGQSQGGLAQGAAWNEKRNQMQRSIASLTARKAEVSEAHGLSNFDKIRRRLKILEPTLQK